MCDPDWSKVFEIIANVAGTLVAAFGGAWLAFKWQRDKERDKDREKEIQSANLNLSLLAAQINNLHSIKTHLLRNVPSDEIRHLTIPPITPPENLVGLNLTFESLAFALKKEPTLIANLSSAQKDINTAIGLVRERSKFHYEHLQPVVEELQREHGGDRGPENLPELIAKKLGFRSNFELKDLTDRMVVALTLGHEVAKQAFRLLEIATLKAHPEANLAPMPAI